MNKLIDNYSYCIINENEFWAIYKTNRTHVFQDNIESYFNNLSSESEKEKLKNLSKNLGNLYKLFIKITTDDGKLVGWSYGKQTDEESFSMINTGIFEEHRGKGLYNTLLKEIINIAKKEGFNKITSRHHVNNNNIIVPKLKAGFIITGLELDDKFGMLVKLTYIFNDTRKDINNFRIGSKKLNKDLEKNLNLWE